MEYCEFCGEELGYLPFKCKHCNGNYCSKHRLPENHECTFEIPQITRKTNTYRNRRRISYSLAYPDSDSIRKNKYQNRHSITALIGTGVLMAILTLLSPAGSYNLISYESYSVTVGIWLFGGYATFYLYDVGFEYLPSGIQGIDTKILFIGLLTTLFIVIAIYILVRLLISLERTKIYPPNSRLICTISGLIFLCTPILWLCVNYIIESSFFGLYYLNFGLIAPFIAGGLILIASYMMRD